MPDRTPLRNVSLTGTAVTWTHVAPNPDDLSVGVYVDGALTARVPLDALRADIPPQSPGTHTLAVHCQRTLAPWPDRHGDHQGNRAYVTWQPSTDPTTRAYNVTIGSATATVRTPRVFAPHATALRGRVTIYGDPPSDTAVNIAATLTINHDATATALDTTVPIAAGLSSPLPHGAWVTFLDDPEDYTPGDTYPFHVGPECAYLSDTLTPGTHTITVTALDEAGNESDPLLSRGIRILNVPAAVTATHTYTDDATLVLTPSGPCAIYTNHDVATDTWWPHLITTNPQHVHTTGTWTFTAPEPGTLRLQLRARGNGIERREAVVRSYAFPPTPVDLSLVLSEAAGATATLLPLGLVRVDWHYRYRPADALASFLVEWGADANVDADSATVARPAGVGAAIGRFAHTIDALAFETLHVRITPRTATGRAALPITLTATPDAVPPTFTGRTLGGAQ